MIKVVIDRASEMLKNPEINAIYQSLKSESEAKDWIIKAAIATLVVPVSERSGK